MYDGNRVNSFYNAKIRNVIDGDTVDMQVNLGFGFLVNARIRFKGVDAPEIYGVKKESEEFKQGQIAFLEVKKWFFNPDEIYLLKAESRGLYGRWLGEIWKGELNESINDYLRSKFYKTKYWEWVHQEPLKEKW